MAEATRLLDDAAARAAMAPPRDALRRRPRRHAHRRRLAGDAARAVAPRSRRDAALWLLLPAYEEAESLPPLLADVRDDARRLARARRRAGSWSWTTARRTTRPAAARAAQGLDVEVLVHDRNQGLGAAMRTGIEHVLAPTRRRTTSSSTMDADHTHPPELMPAMVARVDDGRRPRDRLALPAGRVGPRPRPDCAIATSAARLLAAARASSPARATTPAATASTASRCCAGARRTTAATS